MKKNLLKMKEFTKRLFGYKYFFPLFIILVFSPSLCIIAVQGIQNLRALYSEPVITTQTVYLDDVTCTTRVEGTYIFGCGSVYETKYYEAYAIKEDGRKESFSLNANEIVVYKTLLHGEQPYVEIDKNGPFTIETRLYLPIEDG